MFSQQYPRAYNLTLLHYYCDVQTQCVLCIRFEYDNNGEVAAAMVRAVVLIYEAGKGTEFSTTEYSAESFSGGDLSAQPAAAATNSTNSSSSNSQQQHVIELLAALDSLMQPRPARPDVSAAAAAGDGSTSSTSEYSDDGRVRGRSNGTGNTNVVSAYHMCLYVSALCRF